MPDIGTGRRHPPSSFQLKKDEAIKTPLLLFYGLPPSFFAEVPILLPSLPSNFSPPDSIEDEEGSLDIHLLGPLAPLEGSGGNECGSPPPPPIPPKTKKRRRSRSQGPEQGALLHRGGDRPVSPLAPLDPEELSSRGHLPRKNTVSNALYGRPPSSTSSRPRRLPSPPQGGTKLVEAPDDTFLLDSRLLAGRLSRQQQQQSTDVGSKKLLFCPMCAQTFGHPFALECHILSAHSDELDHIRLGGGGLAVTKCPHCRAQFIGAAAALRHLHYQHEEEAKALLLRKSVSFQDGNKCDRYVECRFCLQRFLRHHHKLMLLHMEQKHVEDLGRLLGSSSSGTRGKKKTVTWKSGDTEDSTTEEIAMLALSHRRRRHKLSAGSQGDEDVENVSPGSPSSLEADHQFLSVGQGAEGKTTDQSHYYYEIREDLFSPLRPSPSRQTGSRRRHSEGNQRSKLKKSLSADQVWIDRLDFN